MNNGTVSWMQLDLQTDIVDGKSLNDFLLEEWESAPVEIIGTVLSWLPPLQIVVFKDGKLGKTEDMVRGRCFFRKRPDAIRCLSNRYVVNWNPKLIRDWNGNDYILNGRNLHIDNTGLIHANSIAVALVIKVYDDPRLEVQQLETENVVGSDMLPGMEEFGEPRLQLIRLEIQGKPPSGPQSENERLINKVIAANPGFFDGPFVRGMWVIVRHENYRSFFFSAGHFSEGLRPAAGQKA